MGGGEPGAGGRGDRLPRELIMPRPATVDELEDWERNGATWRALDISRERAVVELCTCYGEAVDVVESDDPQFILYVRTHPDD